jgi:tRNA(Ile)-lysidine synthase
MRMSRGSGLTGLASMRRLSELPAAPGLRLVRPLLGIPKARLLATLQAAKIGYADDPSNRDPRFTRARFRSLMEALAAEGLGSDALALLVDRLARAADALAAAAERLADEMFLETAGPLRIALETARFAALPDEFRLRLIGRAIERVGDEGPVELGKLEALKCALDAALLAKTPFRRSLAGALVTLAGGTILVETAPPRRSKTLTTSRRGGRGKNALEYAESGLCRPACAAYIGKSLRREFARMPGKARLSKPRRIRSRPGNA